jgi:hypothetical protein
MLVLLMMVGFAGHLQTGSPQSISLGFSYFVQQALHTLLNEQK